MEILSVILKYSATIVALAAFAVTFAYGLSLKEIAWKLVYSLVAAILVFSQLYVAFNSFDNKIPYIILILFVIVADSYIICTLCRRMRKNHEQKRECEKEVVDEENLRLYFRYRDEGHEADPVQIQAEKEYQKELQRRDEEESHSAFEHWKMDREKPITVSCGEYCPFYAVVSLSEKYGKYTWIVYDRDGNEVGKSAAGQATISRSKARDDAYTCLQQMWAYVEKQKKENP